MKKYFSILWLVTLLLPVLAQATIDKSLSSNLNIKTCERWVVKSDSSSPNCEGYVNYLNFDQGNRLNMSGTGTQSPIGSNCTSGLTFDVQAVQGTNHFVTWMRTNVSNGPSCAYTGTRTGNQASGTGICQNESGYQYHWSAVISRYKC